MANEGLVKTYTSGAVIVKRRIVKFSSSDGVVVQASAATDALVGVSDLIAAGTSGDPVDIIRSGVALVEYGGNVTRGAPLTADSDGKAVAAAPTATNSVRIIGFAEVSGVAGDIGKVFIAPGSVSNAANS